MQVKTFKGTSMNEVLRHVKAEFGDEAVIVSSRQGGSGGASSLLGNRVIEVTAARAASVGRRTAPQAQRARTSNGEPAVAVAQLTSAYKEGSTESDFEILKLRKDLSEMRKSLKDVSRNVRFQHKSWGTGLSAEAYERLTQSGLQQESAGTIVEEAQENLPTCDGDFSRSLLASTARRLRCSGVPEKRRAGRPLVLALIGATGAGKTSAIGRLLSSAQAFAGKKVGVLSLDTRKMAATDQLKSLSRILRFPLALAWRSEDVSAAMDKLSRCDVVLVDTPGVNVRRRSEMEALRQRLDAVDPQEIHIVQHGGLRLDEQLRFCEGCREFGAGKLLVTHMDECASPGILLDLCTGSGLSLSWMGLGASMTSPLKLARPDEIARWILDPQLLLSEIV